jgi:hypothetical protein
VRERKEFDTVNFRKDPPAAAPVGVKGGLAFPRTFPLPGTTYYNMLYDPKSKKQFQNGFRIFNKLIAPLYRLGLLPLVGFGNLALVLTIRGRKSGKKRHTPIGYFRYGGVVHIISGWGTGTD